MADFALKTSLLWDILLRNFALLDVILPSKKKGSENLDTATNLLGWVSLTQLRQQNFTYLNWRMQEVFRPVMAYPIEF